MHPGPSPALLWEQFVATRQIGGHLLCYAQADSTMDVAWALASRGSAHGTAVIALDQTRGRGRYGRSWVSAPGQSLTMSVLLRPPAAAVPRLSLTAGLAVVRAVAILAGAHASIKWPNDIRIGGKKVAGILTEARVDTGGSATVVVGVGMNLTFNVADHAEIRETATSLRAATGRDARVAAAADEVLGQLDRAYGELLAGGDVVAAWRDTLDTLGTRVTFRSGNEELTGVAEDIADDGSLLLRLDDGQWARVSAGEVTSQHAP